jgi:3',5'-cyclic AMP phosphodiesterase CpdA
MKLFAISDLHLERPQNWQALRELSPHLQDWLIVAGDVAESIPLFRRGMRLLAAKFAQVIWTPGNHDLWTLPTDSYQLRGLVKYNALVAICRELHIATPEDPFLQWPATDEPLILAPIFTLFDYSFRPAEVTEESAVAWAEQTGVICTDEFLLHTDPYPSFPAWCAARCRETARRLQAVAAEQPLILINHYPLREDLVFLRHIPRFSLWCGTARTQDWHKLFPVRQVIYGHLHIRSVAYRDGIPFHEVSLGYPQNWTLERGMAAYLKPILP